MKMIAVEKITPKKAEQYLNLNTKNRAPVNNVVESYANAMRLGQWKMNGESIKFDKVGNLIDGQHRLMAIVKSETPVEILVHRGLDSDAFETIDTGRKRRPSDVLSVAGYTQQSALAASISVYLQYHSGKLFRRFDKRGFSNREIIAFTQRHPDKVELMYKGFNNPIIRKLVGSSIAGGMYALFYESNPVKAPEFYEVFEKGVADDLNHPAITLRNRLIVEGTKYSKLRQSDKAGMVVRAWNAFLEGRSLKTLKVVDTEDLVIS